MPTCRLAVIAQYLHSKLNGALRWALFLSVASSATLYAHTQTAEHKQEQAAAEQLRFVTTNAEFTLLHEMGHLLIHELKLPVLAAKKMQQINWVLLACF